MKITRNKLKNEYLLTIRKIKLHLFLTCIFLFLILFISLKQNSFSFIRLYNGLPDMADLLFRMFHLNFDNFVKIITTLLDSIYIAIFSSALGTLIAIPFVFISSLNISPNKVIAKISNFIFSLLRTLPSLIYASVLVAVFSPGKFAGLIALTIIAIVMAHKILRETVEAINPNIINSIKSTGAKEAQVLIVCIIPYIIKNIISTFFIILESNVRSSTILGFVGAGGIGQLLWKDLNHLRYDRVSTIIVLIFLFVLAIDSLSLLIRKSLNHNTSSKLFENIKIKNSLNLIIFLIITILMFYQYVRLFDISTERFYRGMNQFFIIIRRLLRFDFSYINKTLIYLFETFAIALSSTIIGTFFSLILSYFAASNIKYSKLCNLIFKCMFNLFRSFPPIITAIIFFRGVGPGAMAAVLSLTLYTVGSLSKLLYEDIENINRGYIEAYFSTGASNFKIYFFIILPQIRDRIISLVLFRFESNIRNSTLLGIVGAGGIGQKITSSLQVRDYEKSGILICVLVVFVFIIDKLSNYIQSKLR